MKLSGSICAIVTPFKDGRIDAAALEKLIPCGRIGLPVDIARAAAWLASDQSDYLYGASIFVDGGMTLYPGFATGG